MNTPSHLIVNLAVLGRVASPGVGRWIAAGALLPDLPMFAFYLWQRAALGASEAHIWGHAYFVADWQRLFDAFNSVPIFAALGLLAVATRRVGPAWLCASVLLHVSGDAFLHREDGHRHLWPLSDARFESPVSYWDPAHYGIAGAGFETLVVFASTFLLWGAVSRGQRALLALWCAVSALGWTAVYAFGWLPS